MALTTVSESYTKATKVWLPSESDVWISAVVTHPLINNKIVVETEEGRSVTVELNGLVQPPPLCNPDILLGANDLTSLSFLHEPAVLHNLKIRFLDLSTIYTYCGIILVAINPYQSLPIYGNETIMAYHGNESRDMDPHVYGVTEQAFRQMKRENRNQSIIISGESGSGKTVSAKYALRYFASVCGAAAETKIEKKVLASNPIMEAIGNAKTTRNDNSSRFGKYIEVGFTKEQAILGATMKTYLLERSRVVTHGSGERNYHVLYQLCAARTEPDLEDLRLLAAEDFHYTNQGSTISINGVDDREEFHVLTQSLHWLGFTARHQLLVFRLLAAILHLGNVAIQLSKASKYDDGSYIDPKGEGIALVAELLGLDGENLCKWLCNKKIVTSRETLIKPLTMSQALSARDSFAKHLYAHLFDWIVSRVNCALQSPEKPSTSVGVLDIYGFEVFKVNSFEQFCINYANEKLQQQFNMHVFKLEQQEYVQEDIEWSFITFYDNQPCIDLIEGRLGVLNLLDETCKMPGSSDAMFLQKLYNNFINKNSIPRESPGKPATHFSKPRTSTTSFNIHHYAYVVTYEKECFIEKNMDSLLPEHKQLLQKSKEQFVVDLFWSVGESRKSKGTGSTGRNSVGSQFRDSLTGLMNTLNSTTPHYIRCIKPNDSKLPFEFNPQRVIEQLRACGVLETIRISAAGFPSRCHYSEFLERYFMLLKWGQRRRGDNRAMGQYILQNCVKDPDKYRMGKTKIFFRAGQIAYLERLRTDKIHVSVLLLQSHVKGWSQRRSYRKIYRAVRGIQRYGRGLLVRRQALHIRQTRAATKIQSVYRMYRAKRWYEHICSCILYIQCCFRRWKANRIVGHLRLVKACLICQKLWRGRAGRVYVEWRRRSIVRVQCRVRVWLAKRQLRALKLEACSVDHLKSLNKGLELKIIELQHKLTDQTVLNSNLNNQIDQLTSRCQELVAKAGFRDEYLVLQKYVSELEVECEGRRAGEQSLEEELNRVKSELEKAKELHKQEIDTYSEHVVHLNNQLAEAQKAAREEETSHREADWLRLQQEHSLLQQHHQNMLQYTSELEEQVTRLSTELESVTYSTSPTKLSESTSTKTGSLPNLIAISSPAHEEEVVNPLAFLHTPLSLTASTMDESEEAELIPPARNIRTTPFLETVSFHKPPVASNSNTEEAQLLQHQLEEIKRQFHEMKSEFEHEKAVLEQTNRDLQGEVTALRYSQSEDQSSVIRLNKSLQQELHRLTEENLSLRERLELLENVPSSQELSLITLSPRLDRTKSRTSIAPGTPPALLSSPIVYRSVQEKPCLGMLSWQLKDLPSLLKTIILDSTPLTSLGDISCQEAHLLFMCLRYADHCSSEEMTSKFIEGVVSCVHRIAQEHRDNLKMLSYWLGNITRFLNNLRQYSGDPLYQCSSDIMHQSSQTSLTSFELSEYHHVVMDQAVYLFQRVLRLIREKIEPMIVPGLMEHNPIPGITSDSRPAVGSNIRKLLLGSVTKHKATVENVEQALTQVLAVLRNCSVEPHMIGQIMNQIFHFINATMLNYLLLRKDMCHWSRGVQIRYNLNILEEWVRDNCSLESGLIDGGIISMLHPMIQASKLLQMKKQTTNDIDQIKALCTKLNALQIQKLVIMYTSSSGLEERVSTEVIRYITKRDQSDQVHPSDLMADASYQFPINFPFSYSNVSYADMKLPQKLSHMIKI